MRHASALVRELRLAPRAGQARAVPHDLHDLVLLSALESQVQRAPVGEGQREDDPPAENPRNKSWVGHVVAPILGLDIEDKPTRARVLSMVRAWVQSGVLLVEETRSARDGRNVKVVLAGPNDPVAGAPT